MVRTVNVLRPPVIGGQTPCPRCAAHSGHWSQIESKTTIFFEQLSSEKPCWYQTVVGLVLQVSRLNQTGQEFLPYCSGHRAAASAERKVVLQEVCVPLPPPICSIQDRGQIVQPIPFDYDVVVNKSQNISTGLSDPRVEGIRFSRVGFKQVSKAVRVSAGEIFYHFARPVIRIVVNDDNFPRNGRSTSSSAPRFPMPSPSSGSGCRCIE